MKSRFALALSLSLVLLTTGIVSAETIWLDSLDLALATQGYGEPSKNKSVDGQPLTIGGQKFTRGFGTHADGRLRLSLDGNARSFSASVGVDDDEIRTGNSMILDPYGRVLTETWKAADTMVVADLDRTLLKQATGREWIAARRPDLYKLLAKRTGLERDTHKLKFEE